MPIGCFYFCEAMALLSQVAAASTLRGSRSVHHQALPLRARSGAPRAGQTWLRCLPPPAATARRSSLAPLAPKPVTPGCSPLALRPDRCCLSPVPVQLRSETRSL